MRGDRSKLEWAVSVLEPERVKLYTKGKPLADLSDDEVWTIVWHAEYQDNERKTHALRTASRGADWGPEGAEAFEREQMVRYALSKTELRDTIAKHPDAVRSAYSRQDGGERRANVVVVFTEYGIGDPFEYPHVHEAFDEAVAILNRDWKHPQHEWSWDSISSGIAGFYLGALARNPKSTVTSSSWTTARDKLRSAAVKKNPWPPDHSSVAEVASEELEYPSADSFRARGLGVVDLLQARIDWGDPADVTVVGKPRAGSIGHEARIGDGMAVAITPRGRVRVAFWNNDPVPEREYPIDQIWLEGTDAPNSLETDVSRGLTPNSPGDKRTARYTAIANERRQWRGASGARWSSQACAPDCRGYAAFVTDRGTAIQACDECNSAAAALGLRKLTDADVRHVAGAKDELAGMNAMLGRRPRGRPRQNPQSAQLEDAKAKFEEFHRKPPTKIGAFASSFEIPKTIGILGDAVHVLYRSDKKDPATGRQGKKPVDYIHEHYAGVKTYAVDDELEQVDVPSFIQKVDALVLLGLCLGFCFTGDDGQDHDAEGAAPLPELYATPCGKALVVVQDKKEVLAMIWGGGLGVWARGIDG